MSDRATIIGYICAALTVIAFITATTYYAIAAKEQDARIAQTCVESGAQWISGDCMHLGDGG